MSFESNSDIAERLRSISTATIMDILRAHEPERLIMQGVRPIRPGAGTMAGPARTLRFLPRRNDVSSTPKGSPQFELIDSAGPGEVLVFDAGGWSGGSVLGDMLATRAEQRGVIGVVTDGVVRDLAGMVDLKIAVYASGLFPVPSALGLIPWDIDIPVRCGGVLVRPGDWIIADAEAAVVVPKAQLELVIEKVDGLLAEEEFSRGLLLNGHSLKQAFPMPGALRPLFDRFRQKGTLPTSEEIQSALNGSNA